MIDSRCTLLAMEAGRTLLSIRKKWSAWLMNIIFAFVLSIHRFKGNVYEIMFSAGEASGDMHGASLARAIKELAPEVELIGMGGTKWLKLASASYMTLKI